MKTNTISHERAIKALRYDPETGVFVWLEGNFKGKEAGSISSEGYSIIGLDCQRFRASRLAFLIMTKKFPDEEVDFINGIRNDNRWVNLREATTTQNAMNRRHIARDNTSGITGVHWCKVRKKWRVQIGVNRKTKTVGYYDCKKAAARARRHAEIEHYQDFAPKSQGIRRHG